jgi:hypothetical protein
MVLPYIPVRMRMNMYMPLARILRVTMEGPNWLRIFWPMIPSVSTLLLRQYGTTGNTSIDFTYLLEKLAEAFIFTDPSDGRATFNQTVTKTIGGTAYTFTGFNIWNARYNLTVPANSYRTWGGPTIYPLTNQPTMQPHSVYVQSSGDWQTGTLSSVTLNKPANTGVKLFLMIR